jgi:hypothetical protein
LLLSKLLTKQFSPVDANCDVDVEARNSVLQKDKRASNDLDKESAQLEALIIEMQNIQKIRNEKTS